MSIFDKSLLIRIDSKMREDLKLIAEYKVLSVSDIARQALRQYISAQKRFLKDKPSVRDLLHKPQPQDFKDEIRKFVEEIVEEKVKERSKKEE